MKRRFRFDQNAYKLLFLHNEAYVIPALLIIVCIGVFYFLIGPQYQELQDMRKEEETTRAHIDVLQKNVTLLNSLNDSVLDGQLQTVSRSLPAEKDFIGILNAIAIAAANSNAQVDDFFFVVGALNAPKVTSARQSLQVEFSIKGGAIEAKQFLAALGSQIPLQEVSSSESENTLSKFTVVFYYKPYVQAPFDSNQVLSPLSPKDMQILSDFTSLVNAPVPTPASPTVSVTPSPSVSPVPSLSPAHSNTVLQKPSPSVSSIPNAVVTSPVGQ